MGENIIEAVGVAHAYKHLKALDGLNLSVGKGSVYALLGLNGSGKTTFIRLLTGQLGLQEGTINILGREISPAAIAAVNAKTGYVPENRNMYPYMTARQMFDFTRGFYRGSDCKAASHCMQLFDIPMNRKIADFSRGMKSQLALALSLCGEPELLILDEPTDGLDPLKRNQFFNIVLDRVGDSGKTVFMTTNTIADVERIADHIGIIRNGCLHIHGETGSIVENSRKVRIAFADECNPDFQNWPGVLRVEKENRSYLVHIGGNADEILGRMRQLPSIFMDVINMSIEDIFVEINGGMG